ncbi:MAG: PfkB family carbohydrate kinase [Acidobacteria bacterium]|nr:PfkB family carbohydrate kinase [Acidobacteriota bacterium]
MTRGTGGSGRDRRTAGGSRPGREELLEGIARMEGVSVLVVGDLVLDEFEYGEIGRVSREAPVLILNHRRTDRLPGGGANAAANIIALGGRAAVVGRLGPDEAGTHLSHLLESLGVDISGLWRDDRYRTPLKRRILAGSPHATKQQIVRVDRGGGPEVLADDSRFRAALKAATAGARGALVSDYGLGLLNPASIPMVTETVGEARIPMFIDSRAQLRQFRGVTAATPNLQEAESALGEPIGEDAALLQRAAGIVRDAIGAEAVVITRGSYGMSLFADTRDPIHIPVYGTDEVADVTGAGDTVISTFTLAALSGSNYHEAALLANYAGGIVVMKRGTATVGRDELRRAVEGDPTLGRRT